MLAINVGIIVMCLTVIIVTMILDHIKWASLPWVLVRFEDEQYGVRKGNKYLSMTGSGRKWRFGSSGFHSFCKTYNKHDAIRHLNNIQDRGTKV